MTTSIVQRLSGQILSGTLLLSLGRLGQASAQTPADSARRPEKFYFSAAAQAAIIARHTASVAHLVASHPTGWELAAERRTSGRAPWHGWFRYPRLGLALVYYDFHNPVLGQSLAATLYLSKRLSRGPRHEANFRLGTGLAWFTTPYDVRTNRRNVFVSSRLNATMQARLDYEHYLGRHLGLLLGLGLNHYSNSGTTRPNFGVNLPTLQLGLRYRPAGADAPPSGPLAPPPPDVGRWFGYLSASWGSKQRTGGDPTHYSAWAVSALAGRRMNAKSNLLLGFEGFQDNSLRALLRDTARDLSHLPDIRRASVVAGHELLLGRLALTTQLGVYVYSPYRSSFFFYERLGLKYQLTDWLFAAVETRVHLVTADVLELRLGYRLARRREGLSD